MTKLAIYTVLTGDKEPLGNPITRLESHDTDLEIDFICFTDNLKLYSDVWECRAFNTYALPPEKSSRRPKILPHEYLSNYDYSLYLDNICELKRLPNSIDLTDGNDSEYCYKLFRHNTRNFVTEEAFAIAKLGYDSAQALIEQLEAYRGTLPLELITSLSTCTVLLREHNNPNVISHGNQWWQHLLCFSKRDQMSFDFCRLTTNLAVTYFTGNKFENDLIHAHSNTAGSRKLANFDKYKFNWLQSFYVKTGLTIEAANEKASLNAAIKAEDFELALYLNGSSFGNYHMPRRNASDILSGALVSLVNSSSKVTLLWRDENHFSFWHTSESELLTLLKIITLYLQTDKISAFKYDTDLDRQSLHRSIDNQTSLVIVFNASNSDKIQIKKFSDDVETNGHHARFIVFSDKASTPWCVGFQS